MRVPWSTKRHCSRGTTRRAASLPSRSVSTLAGSSALAMGYGRCPRCPSDKVATRSSTVQSLRTRPSIERPPSVATGASRRSVPSRVATSNCQPTQISVRPSRRGRPSPKSASLTGSVLHAAPAKYGSTALPPRFETSRSAIACSRRIAFGRRTMKFADALTRPLASRGARARSAMPALAAWAGSSANSTMPDSFS